MENNKYVNNFKSNIDHEDETYLQRKSFFLEKINYYKFIIKNTNHQILTSNNSLLANISVTKNKDFLRDNLKLGMDLNLSNKIYNTENIDILNSSNENNDFNLNNEVIF